MKQLKQVYNKINVLDAAKERISKLFDMYENIIVSVSGGKDSTVLCHLALQEAIKRNRKIGVFFLDEEVDYESTIDQIRYLMNLDSKHIIKYWLQIEFNLTNSTSLTETQLHCWERGKHKEWMRKKEPDAITSKPWPIESETIADKTKGFGFYDALDAFERMHPNTAFLVGLRAIESPNRWKAVSKNPGVDDLCWTTSVEKISKGSVKAYPIYDWYFQDIWKYIYDNNLRYNKIYDYQAQKGIPIPEIRVSSLIHEKSYKSLVELPEFEPKTYDKLLARCKGVSVGHIYGKDKKLLRCQALPKNFNSWIDYRDFLLTTYPDEDKKRIFVKRFSRHLNNEYVARQQCRQLILNDYENNLPIKNQEDPRIETINKWRKILL